MVKGHGGFDRQVWRAVEGVVRITGNWNRNQITVLLQYRSLQRLDHAEIRMKRTSVRRFQLRKTRAASQAKTAVNSACCVTKRSGRYAWHGTNESPSPDRDCCEVGGTWEMDMVYKHRAAGCSGDKHAQARGSSGNGMMWIEAPRIKRRENDARAKVCP